MDYSNSITPLLMNIIATKQGELFEYAENKGHNMTNFITQYMLSNFCNQEMDSDYSYFHLKMPEVCYSYVINEICEVHNDSKGFINAAWVGQIYRYLVFLTGIHSRDIVNMISPADLDDMALVYETTSVEDAAEKIVKLLKEKYSTLI